MLLKVYMFNTNIFYKDFPLNYKKQISHTKDAYPFNHNPFRIKQQIVSRFQRGPSNKGCSF